MSIYAFRSLRKQTVRTVLSISGISLCLLLMLFLLSAYNGVKKGSLDYIEKNPADLWVLQKNATNVLRCTSVLFANQEYIIKNIPNVKSVHPILLVLATVGSENSQTTIYLCGYEPSGHLGGPPEIIEGHHIENDNEIVLDYSFARKYDYHVGQTISIKHNKLAIVGLSSGTNAFVVQYAFVSLTRAQALINYPIITAFLIRIEETSKIDTTMQMITGRLTDVEVYDHETFVLNNLRELQAGFLPFVLTIVGIGIVVLTVVLSLLLSINIIEQRKDFAIMKIIGSSGRFLIMEILGQSFVLSLFGYLMAGLCLWPLIKFIAILTPEVTVLPTLVHFVVVLLITGCIATLSAGFSMLKLRKIYPMEVFQ